MTSAVGFTKPPSPWSAGATQCHKDGVADGGVCGDLQTAKERLASVFPISLCHPNTWHRPIGSYWKWYRLRIYPWGVLSLVGGMGGGAVLGCSGCKWGDSLVTPMGSGFSWLHTDAPGGWYLCAVAVLRFPLLDRS
jgi:hypothetical protein